MPGPSPEISSFLLSQGWAGVVILILLTCVIPPLLGVVVYLFKRFDGEREARIGDGLKYAELATSSANALKIANDNASAMIAAVQTFKLLSDLDQRARRP